MSLLRRDKEKKFSGSDVEKALQQSNPYAFRQAVEEVYKAGGGSVTVGKKETKSSAPAIVGDDFTVEEVKDSDHFLEDIRKKWKNGLYLLRVYDQNKRLHSEHHFLLGGMKPAKKTGKKKKKKPSGFNGMSVKEYTKLTKAIRGKDNGGVSVGEMLQIQQKNMEMQQAQHQASLDRQMQMFQMMMSSGGSSTEEALAILQVAQQIQPHVEKEEPMMQLLAGLSPIVGELIRAKSGGGQIDLRQIEAEVRQRLAAAAPGAPPVQHAPPPGASSSTGDLGGQTAAAPAPVFAAGTHEYFDQRFIKPFQRDVAEEKPAEELAYSIVSMVQYARDRMPDNPPLLVADFLRAESVADHIAALDKFFGAIPELSALTQKQLEIKGVLMQMFTGSPDTPGEVFAEESETVLEEERSAPIIHINEDQTVDQGEIQDAADREFIREDGTEEAREVEDQSDSDGSGSELDHETVPGRVG